MNHKLDGDKCTVCGQAGLELEDECPGGAIPPPPTEPTRAPRSSLPKATAKTPILRETITTLKANAANRKSFDRERLTPLLEQAAAAIQHVQTSPKTTRAWNGEELRLILAGHGLRAVLIDDANVGPCCGLCLEPKA